MNQNPEQLTRDCIDEALTASGWTIQGKKSFNLAAGKGVTIREYATTVSPADYGIFVSGKPAGVIEAKCDEEGVRLTIHLEQSVDYCSARPKYFDNDPMLINYEHTGKLTFFAYYLHPKPGSWPAFYCHRLETILDHIENEFCRCYSIMQHTSPKYMNGLRTKPV